MIDDIEVSLWATVFRSTSLRTLHYFMDRFITGDNVLVRARTRTAIDGRPVRPAE